MQYLKDRNNAADSSILGYMPSSLGFPSLKNSLPQIYRAKVGVAWVCTPAPALIGYYMNYLTVFHLVVLSVRWGLYSQGRCQG